MGGWSLHPQLAPELWLTKLHSHSKAKVAATSQAWAHQGLNVYECTEKNIIAHRLCVRVVTMRINRVQTLHAVRNNVGTTA